MKKAPRLSKIAFSQNLLPPPYKSLAYVQFSLWKKNIISLQVESLLLRTWLVQLIIMKLLQYAQTCDIHF